MISNAYCRLNKYSRRKPDTASNCHISRSKYPGSKTIVATNDIPMLQTNVRADEVIVADTRTCPNIDPAQNNIAVAHLNLGANLGGWIDYITKWNALAPQSIKNPPTLFKIAIEGDYHGIQTARIEPLSQKLNGADDRDSQNMAAGQLTILIEYARRFLGRITQYAVNDDKCPAA